MHNSLIVFRYYKSGFIYSIIMISDKLNYKELGNNETQ